MKIKKKKEHSKVTYDRIGGSMLVRQTKRAIDKASRSQGSSTLHSSLTILCVIPQQPRAPGLS